MHATFLDRLLCAFLFAQLVVAASLTRAVAEDAPSNPCDSECRERRMFKYRDKKDSKTCYLFERHTCSLCTAAQNGICYYNPDAQPDNPTWRCSKYLINQRRLVTECDALCGFSQPGLDQWREGQETPQNIPRNPQYGDISSDAREEIRFVFKCVRP